MWFTSTWQVVRLGWQRVATQKSSYLQTATSPGTWRALRLTLEADY